MTQQLMRPPEETQEQQLPLFPDYDYEAEPQSSRIGIISLLVIVGMLLLLFTGLLLNTLPQTLQPAPQPTPSQAATPTAPQLVATPGPLQIPGKVAVPDMTPFTGRSVVYEQQQNVYLLDTPDGLPQVINTPGYLYNRSIPVILTPQGQLLYSGDGIWVTDLFNGTPQQLAKLPEGYVVTSLVLSRDGKQVAWSFEPVDGTGDVLLYAGSLEKPKLVYQHSVTDCPCFRVFSFLEGSKKTTLLLTDDRGDHSTAQYGLWSLELPTKSKKKNAKTTSPEPKLLLEGDQPQGPLSFAPRSNTLLYTTYQGVVATPLDGSVPTDYAASNYANSLALAQVSGKKLLNNNVLLPEQHELSNPASYHWVTTPLFSPDERTLVYVEFSSDAQEPFTRHSALYKVKINASGNQLKVEKPQLLATSNDRFIELGNWLDSRVLTFYANGSMYALDTQTGAVTTLAKTGAYARIVAVVKTVWQSI